MTARQPWWKRNLPLIAVAAPIIAGLLTSYFDNQEIKASLARVERRIAKIERTLDRHKEFHSYQCFDDWQIVKELKKIIGEEPEIKLIADPE